MTRNPHALPLGFVPKRQIDALPLIASVSGFVSVLTWIVGLSIPSEQTLRSDERAHGRAFTRQALAAERIGMAKLAGEELAMTVRLHSILRA